MGLSVVFCLYSDRDFSFDAAKPLYDQAEEPGGGRKADHAALEAAGRTESEASSGRDLKASGGGAEAGRFAGG